MADRCSFDTPPVATPEMIQAALDLVWEDSENHDELVRNIWQAMAAVAPSAEPSPRAQALEQAAQFAPAMVPAKMLLEAKSIQDLLFILGGCDEENPYHDGILWVGTMPDEDGDIYGLHVYSNEYPEEGSITLATFVPPALPASPGASE
ncbi:hypothetical protein [Brucella pseudogrignonensis]|uniref:hypothetical protein n=1 Tax=Brucella pseudogrignonensis TaxID=419475 RepID=UPI0038D06F0F